MNKQLNVCLLNDSFPPVLDGVANVVLNYAQIIHSSFGSAVVAVPRYPGANYDYPFPVVHYPSIKTPKTAGYRTGIPLLGVLRELTDYPIDIIHCHCPFISSLIAKRLRHATGAPVIMTYHTKFDVDFENVFDSNLLQTAAKKIIVSNIESCDDIWAVSRGAGENMKSLGCGRDYMVMDNGVDFPKGPAEEKHIREISNELGLSDDIPVFLYVGRMMWYKGIALTLNGLMKAKSEGSRFKMVFVGGGGDFDEITELSRRNDLENECIFTGPIRDREKLRAIYSRADMFLFPSTFDSAPMAVREASACGLASVLIRGSSSAEPVTDGRNAVLIDEDAESLARAVIELSKNKEYMNALGQRAMDDLYLPWDTVVGRAYERYCEVLGSNSTLRTKEANK